MECVKQKDLALPPNIQSVLHLDENQGAGTNMDMEIGQILKYQNHKGRIRKCTIVDCGTGRLRGTWYMVIHADDNEVMISKRELVSSDSPVIRL